MGTQVHRAVCALMVLLMAAVVAAGWFLVAQPQLAAAAAADEQVASVHAQVASSQSGLQHLREQKAKLPALTAQLAALQQSIPSTLGSSPLVAGIDAAAAKAGVFITDISVDDPAAYAPLPVGAATVAKNSSGTVPAPPSSSAPSASPSPTPSSTPAPTSTGKQSYVPVTDPRITAANFVPVPVQITVYGDWSQTLAFIKNVQQGTRLYSVESMSSKYKSDDESKYVTTVTGYVYALVDPSSVAGRTAAEARDEAGKKGLGHADAATPSSTPSATPDATDDATSDATPSSTPTPGK